MKSHITTYSFIKKDVKEWYNLEVFNRRTQQSLYWLGFIYGNGSLSTKKQPSEVSVTFQGKDEKHLHMLRELLCPKARVRNHSDTSTTDTRLTVSFYDYALHTQITKTGLPPRHRGVAGGTMNPPLTIYRNTHHFIRGYIDGVIILEKDALVIPRINERFLNWIITNTGVLGNKELNTSFPPLHPGKQCCKWTIKNPSELSKLHSYLYDDANIFLSTNKVTMQLLSSANITSSLLLSCLRSANCTNTAQTLHILLSTLPSSLSRIRFQFIKPAPPIPPGYTY